MADSQQKAVYSWERQWGSWSRRSSSQQAVRQAIRAAERLYRIPPMVIQFRKRAKNAAGAWLPSTYNSFGLVAIRPHHTNIATGLHETAHAVLDRLMGWAPKGIEDHGPQWLGVYLCLLTHAKVAPREALEASARAAGLKWIGPGWIGPRKIRKHYRGKIRKAKAFWLY